MHIIIYKLRWAYIRDSVWMKFRLDWHISLVSKQLFSKQLVTFLYRLILKLHVTLQNNCEAFTLANKTIQRKIIPDYASAIWKHFKTIRFLSHIYTNVFQTTKIIIWIWCWCFASKYLPSVVNKQLDAVGMIRPSFI